MTSVYSLSSHIRFFAAWATLFFFRRESTEQTKIYLIWFLLETLETSFPGEICLVFNSYYTHSPLVFSVNEIWSCPVALNISVQICFSSFFFLFNLSFRDSGAWNYFGAITMNDCNMEFCKVTKSEAKGESGCICTEQIATHLVLFSRKKKLFSLMSSML